MSGSWSWLDASTRAWWRTLGRPIDPEGEHRWLRAPVSGAGSDDWLQRLTDAGRVHPASAGAGLLPSIDDLAGPSFDPTRIDPLVRDFYEHTADWSMQVWSQWRTAFAPAGELIARAFGRRVGQLAIPVAPLALSRGMSSSVRLIDAREDEPGGAAWIRTFGLDGSTVYSGFYRVDLLPGSDQPHVHVTFPLEAGNVQVFLRPRVDADGSLWLESRSRRFGEDGAYVVAQHRGRTYAARVPLQERFHVFTDEQGVLRTDHWLDLLHRPALQLHYRLDRNPPPQAG